MPKFKQGKSKDKPTKGELVKCEKCDGTGLDLPEGDRKYLSQAQSMCAECEGSGQILK